MIKLKSVSELDIESQVGVEGQDEGRPLLHNTDDRPGPNSNAQVIITSLLVVNLIQLFYFAPERDNDSMRLYGSLSNLANTVFQFIHLGAENLRANQRRAICAQRASDGTLAVQVLMTALSGYFLWCANNREGFESDQSGALYNLVVMSYNLLASTAVKVISGGAPCLFQPQAVTGDVTATEDELERGAAAIEGANSVKKNNN